MKKAKAANCACRSVSVKMPFTDATSGSIIDVMKPHAKNNVVTAANAGPLLVLTAIDFLPSALNNFIFLIQCRIVRSQASGGNKEKGMQRMRDWTWRVPARIAETDSIPFALFALGNCGLVIGYGHPWPRIGMAAGDRRTGRR